ncbi:hypothetical protein [Nocardiopsis alborubida]|uniref:Uncharacterized protein n=2 Tax=Nocardiopsis alborubida TaxID=146802 RepID=A0A7X6MCB0_9ACTN|nr:hypothetical protein [Nocardiopsis alborubida]NKY98192.1 hypothetical protein [Nocardiopsis alborubida]
MMSLEEQNEILQSIVDLVLRENRDEGWTDVKIRFSGLVSVSSLRAEKTRADGSTELVPLPPDVGVLYNKLRTGMHQRGKGTWYNAWTVVEPTGVSETDFEYDVPPVFQNPIGPRSFYEDMHYFPRLVDEIPEWLMQKLREARLMGRGKQD